MDEKVLAMWRKKVEGVRFDPPIDYKMTLDETVRNLGNSSYSVLDIGTGIGKTVFENSLNLRYNKVVGIDLEEGMVDVCKAKALGMDNVEFHVMDSTKPMSFRASSFDVVTCMFAPFDPQEVNRVMTMGGWLVYLNNVAGDHKEMIKVYPELAKLITHGKGFKKVSEQNQELRDAGFEIIGNNVLRYKWVFRDEESLKNFYEKISFGSVFDGKEARLQKLAKRIDGTIPVTRVMCTTIARKT